MTFFTNSVSDTDPTVAEAISQELTRQQFGIELIASENIVSQAVLEAQGSVLTNKYAEGYPGRRYYGGCELVDVVEQLAIERAKTLFGCHFANVQPHSGAQANQAVFAALLSPGDTILGLDLAAGGHLTPGHPANISGKWFNAVSYTVGEDECIDMDSVAIQADRHKPRLIIAGGSAYARHWEFERFRQIADDVGAKLLVDMAHIAGLVAGGAHPSPFPHAHVVTSTTHKTLRGPRGGIVLTNDEAIAKAVNSAVFPGIQGGPLMHVIAAKAVAFREALQPSFASYAHSVVVNAQALADVLIKGGLRMVTGGTDNHLLLVDLRSKGITGKQAETALNLSHLTCNKNAIPRDPQKPAVTSGIRLGTPAGTTRGFGITEWQRVGKLIVQTINAESGGNSSFIEHTRQQVVAQVKELCEAFPIYR
jgi:glycine hydroxymethyltransferase